MLQILRLVCHYLLLVAFTALMAHTTEAGPRAVPQPLQGHPGNIFLADEQVILSVPNEGAQYFLEDGRKAGNAGFALGHQAVVECRAEGGQLRFGKLRPGYYEVWQAVPGVTNSQLFARFAVLEPLRAPTPADSPIGGDVAMAWLVPPDKMAAVASFEALAGLNWVRDRLNWEELEPARGLLNRSNKYDASVQTQAEAGLRILEVSHRSPAWANPNQQRFPPDLRDIFEYHRNLARRWRGKVAAFEPWNEADITAFGGHSGSEIATLQKAAYLGLKAGNPKVIACLNVLAIHRAATLRDLADNEAWPYFDTFNLHHYEPFTNYPRLYGDFRAVSGGKPLWVTECSLPVKWTGDAHAKEPSPGDLWLQSERVPMTFALALHQGASAVFYFILPNYAEGQTQFGLLHADLTPRPGFVALAAVGRLLADAEPLGKLRPPGPIEGYLFAAKPDGRSARVLVAWADGEGIAWPLPETPRACFDHLGRELLLEQGAAVHLGRAPIFVVFNERVQLPLIAPPSPARLLRGKPSPIVLQALWHERDLLLEQSAYKIETNCPTAVPLFLYNFGPRSARGHLRLTTPEGWTGQFPGQIEIAPGERRELPLTLARTSTDAPGEATFRIVGDFGAAGRPVLSFRVQAQSQ